ncbi:autotransporter domain-containing protein [Aeromonas dhakensis]|uniref:autotransporter domain-containing protein n=1 Tax=Aeromonas dhakensis TaxID=196024 RepID=UPI002157A4E6|nr:autotransporter domain-containing protein [Aeromonas dhakensis]MCR6737865.1 autotransporter domain-containing protein [Aeromonas dhakensis]
MLIPLVHPLRSALLLTPLLGLGQPAMAEEESRVQQRANAVVSLMTFTVVPDITASNINIGSGTNQSSALNMTQVGGGATMSESVPVYLEGTLGFSRYDPQFVISNGSESRTLPTKWNSLTATGGIGWDIGLHRDRHGGNLVLRPIGNVTLGTVASDLRIGNWLLGQYTGKNLDFLDGGRLDVYGLGGAMMLDYELFSPAQDIDAELRYSYQHLQSFGGTAASVTGQANAENLGLYLRRRAPIGGLTLLGKPVRYVLEGARTEYLGEQRGLLGFNSLNSLGLGLELDSSKYDIFVTRTRLVARYMFSHNTSGYGVGLAMSF